MIHSKTARLLALMAALAVGSAAAQTSAPSGTDTVSRSGNLTDAGTAISNTASATFTDPAAPGQSVTVNSNTVTTTVAERQAFNVTYVGGGDGPTTDDPAGAPAAYTRVGNQGSTQVFEYVALNNGNAAQTITLSSNVTGVENVRFFAVDPATNPGATPITDLALPVAEEGGAGVRFWMAYDIPAGADFNTQVGATPIGTGLLWDGTENVATTEEPNAGGNELWWQYSRVTVFQPQGIVGPLAFPEGNGSGNYTDPNVPATTITRLNDTQTATPQAAVTTVTFLNTLQNTAAQADDFNLLAQNVPAGTTVTFLTPSGQAFTAEGVTEGGATYRLVDGVPTVTGVDPGQNVDFQVVVNTPTPATNNVTVTVAIESLSDADTVPEDFTTNTVLFPGGQFGDNPPGPDNTPTDTPVNVVAQPGTPADFPMAIRNTGGAPDTFTPSAPDVTFTVVDANGVESQVTVPVVYLLDSNCDGTPDTTTATGPITLAPGATACVVARVVVPEGAIGQVVPLEQTVTSERGLVLTDNNNTITVAQAGNLVIGKFVTSPGRVVDTEYIVGNPGVFQTATPAPGTVFVSNPADFSAVNTEFAPGVQYDYRIIARNGFNVPVENFSLSDTLAPELIPGAPTCSLVVGASTTPCTATVSGNVVSTTPLSLPAGARIVLTIPVTIR